MQNKAEGKYQILNPKSKETFNGTWKGYSSAYIFNSFLSFSDVFWIDWCQREESMNGWLYLMFLSRDAEGGAMCWEECEHRVTPRSFREGGLMDWSGSKKTGGEFRCKPLVAMQSTDTLQLCALGPLGVVSRSSTDMHSQRHKNIDNTHDKIWKVKYVSIHLNIISLITWDRSMYFHLFSIISSVYPPSWTSEVQSC